MDDEATEDPRGRRLASTEEEIDAWARREHARREAWLGGPSSVEKDDWVRRSRRRAALGRGESRLPPTSAEIDQWAESERRRRQAWIQGPTAEERRRWARQRSLRVDLDVSEPGSAPPLMEMEDWARHENQLRREWLAGPTGPERSEWARHQTEASFGGRLHLPSGFEAEKELPSSLAGEAELAARGSLSALSRASAALWSYLARAGRSAEGEPGEPPRRSRVPY